MVCTISSLNAECKREGWADDGIGLNFFQPENETILNVGDGLGQCVLEAHAAYTALGDSLYGLEIGNEVNCKSHIRSKVTEGGYN